MASNDYIPGASTLVPGTNTTNAAVTGAGNYNQAAPQAAAPGGDSVPLHQQIADEIGISDTDAAAVLQWVINKGFAQKSSLPSKAAYVANVGTQSGTDVASVLADVNTVGAKVNAVLAALQNAGLMAAS